MKVIIVGGVAGGASTAAKLRRLDEQAEIIMFERGAEISYANCGIPYHIGNVIKERSQLTIVSKNDFEKMFKVKVRILSEVLSIDRANKRVKVKDLQRNETYEETYDKLVLSPGGAAGKAADSRDRMRVHIHRKKSCGYGYDKGLYPRSRSEKSAGGRSRFHRAGTCGKPRGPGHAGFGG